MSEESVSVDLTLRDGFAFEADFGLRGVEPLLLDEPFPLGEGRGPSASRLLAAAVGNCMSASLLYCLRRAHVNVTGMQSHVDATLERNERGRLRVGSIKVLLHPEVAPEDVDRLTRCTELFEDFCVVGQSVAAGIDVQVDVQPGVAVGAT